MSNKLFSDPIISSDSDLDKDYTLDKNGVDLDPNQESFYQQNNESDETADTKINEEVTKNNVDIKDSDIFATEPLDSQEVKRANNLTNNYAEKMDQTYNDTVVNEYEDEPDLTSKTTRNWIIFGVIAIIVLICGGWFVYSMVHKENTKQPVTNNNVVVTPAPETTDPNTQTPSNGTSGNSGSTSSDNSSNYDNSDYDSDYSSNSDSGYDSGTNYDQGYGNSSNSDTSSDTSQDSSSESDSNDSTTGDTPATEENTDTSTDATNQSTNTEAVENTDNSNASAESNSDTTAEITDKSANEAVENSVSSISG